MTLGGRIPNLSGDCRVFVGFFRATRHRIAQWNQWITCDLSGLSGFYREERAAEKTGFSEQVAQLARNCLKRWT